MFAEIIIPATASHLYDICVIEESVSPAPWTINQFEESFKYHSAAVLEQAGVVRGFVIFTCVAQDAELINIAVDPAWQGKGLGSGLLEFCLQAVSMKAERLFLDVRVSNFPAIALYLKKDFVQVGERRDYYRKPPGREDALVMCRDMLAHPLR